MFGINVFHVRVGVWFTTQPIVRQQSVYDCCYIEKNVPYTCFHYPSLSLKQVGKHIPSRAFRNFP